MNYIYDILVNFNEKFYEFYEWNEKDEITHIKKLPILKVKSQFLNITKNNDVEIDKKIVEKIHNKTNFFKNNKYLKQNYICALTDGKEAIVIKTTENGTVTEKSGLLLDEENEIIDICECLQADEYQLKKTKDARIDNFKTRKELEINEYIIKELNNINEEKLKYLYFECFNKKETNIKIILNNILKEIKYNFDNVYLKIYDFLKLTSINK